MCKNHIHKHTLVLFAKQKSREIHHNRPENRQKHIQLLSERATSRNYYKKRPIRKLKQNSKDTRKEVKTTTTLFETNQKKKINNNATCCSKRMDDFQHTFSFEQKIYYKTKK